MSFLEVAADSTCSHPPSPGTHYIRGVNNTRQPWHSSEGRKQYSLKPANPTEEGLASLHSVLFRKQPFLWRAALLYYTIERASRLSFSALFQDLEQYVQDASVRWEYCVRAKRGQTDTSQPGTTRGGKRRRVLEGTLFLFLKEKTVLAMAPATPEPWCTQVTPIQHQRLGYCGGQTWVSWAHVPHPLPLFQAVSVRTRSTWTGFSASCAIDRPLTSHCWLLLER